eukprot:1559212-Amphidinium_carterae.1
MFQDLCPKHVSTFIAKTGFNNHCGGGAVQRVQQLHFWGNSWRRAQLQDDYYSTNNNNYKTENYI